MTKATARPGKEQAGRSEQKSPQKKSVTDKTAVPKKRSPKPKKAATEAPVKRNELVYVGIGASAGGLEALRMLLNGLPETSGNMVYFITQHLDPKHDSLLTTLLARETRMPVHEAEDGTVPKPGHVYVYPANRDLLIKRGKIRLRMPSNAIGPKPSVDLFFNSLAENCNEQSVGVILSGTGSDGAHGIRAIKAAGGLAIAQDPTSAKYNGMPVSAIDTGAVDLVLPPSQIADEMAQITERPRSLLPLEPTEKELSAFDRILRLVKRHTHCDFSDYKPNTVMRRIDRRMAATRKINIDDFLAHLESHPDEVECLCKDILISVTAFFRDGDAFKALGKALAELLSTKIEGDDIRIWVPGCATGEEVYSIAILISEALGNDRNLYNIQIFGTDLDTDATLTARRGIYPAVLLESMDPNLRKRYFTRLGESFQVIKSIREMCLFAKQDIISHPPFLRVDLVSCRNLLIYFNATLQRRIMELFHYALQPNGLMFLGKSETIGDYSHMFKAINRKWRIFRRSGESRAPVAAFSQFDMKLAEPLPRRRPRDPSPAEVQMWRLLVDTYAPPCVIVDERHEVRHVFGDMSDYLEFPSGAARLHLHDLAQADFRSTLRALVHKAFREKRVVQSRKVRRSKKRGRSLPGVSVSVRPFMADGDETPMAAVCFEPIAERSAGDQYSAGQDDAADARIRELEEELAMTRQNLQTVIEELETSNEELQSVNEELQASNEELQSSNEELGTSNEELQSTNEELVTVNDELQVKSAELAEANSDLENIQNSIGFALVVVDRDLRVTRYTPLAITIFSIIHSDIGQVITSIPAHIELPGLRQNLQQVIKSGQPFEEEVRAAGILYQMRLIPYTDSRGEISGAVLTFLDRSELDRAYDNLKTSFDRLEMARRISGLASWELNPVTKTMLWTEQASKLFGLPTPVMEGDLAGMLNHVYPADRERVREHFEESCHDHSRLDIEHRITKDDGSVHWVRQLGQTVSAHEGQSYQLVGVAMDIDPLKQIETRRLREDALLDLVDGLIAIVDSKGHILSANTGFRSEFGSDMVVDGEPCWRVLGCDACSGGNNPDCLIANPRMICENDHEPCARFESRWGPVSIKPVLTDDAELDRFIVWVMGPRDQN